MSATTAASLQPDVPRELLIGGGWRAATGRGRFAVHDPADDRELGTVADATPADAVAAVAAADTAFGGWRRTAPRRRADLLRGAHDRLLAERERFAVLLTLEMGKPLDQARAEVDYAAAYLRWYGEQAVRIDGRTATLEGGGGRLLTERRPVGPCLFVTPWNFPLAMAVRKIAPALAAGCTCVVKPARQTPLATLAFGRLLERAGAPPGVLNVVTARSSAEVVAAMLRDPRLRKLSFTGSTEVGRVLLAQAAERVLRVSMELGGNAPFVVLEDADVGRAVAAAVAAKMRNMGQACTAANRFYVHEASAARFAGELAERMAALRIGHGTAPDVDVGPLIDRRQRDRVHALVEDAVARGARPLCGATVEPGPGAFYRPTVLCDVPPDAAILREEIFGPVAPVVAVRDDDDAIARATATDLGLAAYVVSGDLGRAMRIADELDVGLVGLNRGTVSDAGAPFGGVNQSGYGREGGPEGIEEYLQTTGMLLPER